MFLGSGDALPDMKRLAVELGLEDHVEFGGWADDERVGELLATADVGLAPDPRSPLNDASTMIKVAEYMSMGLSVVAFDLPESVVTAEGAALFVPGNDEAAFAASCRGSPRRPRTAGATRCSWTGTDCRTPVVVDIRGTAAGSVPTRPRPPIRVAAAGEPHRRQLSPWLVRQLAPPVSGAAWARAGRVPR